MAVQVRKVKQDGYDAELKMGLRRKRSARVGPRCYDKVRETT